MNLIMQPLLSVGNVFQLQISSYAGLHGHSLPANSLDWFGLLLSSAMGHPQ